MLTAAGMVAGAALSGHPIQFLWQGAVHAVRAAGGGWPSYLLVGEFQPSSGSLQFLVCVGLIVAAAGRHRDLGAWARNPVAWLAAIGWLLGLSSQRFWFDWGLPAAVFCLADLLETSLVAGRAYSRAARVVATAVVAFALTLAVSADHGRRWSNELWRLYAPIYAPQNRTWLPDRGGVLYNTDMNIFYLGVYLNPQMDYRFEVGFEPALLPDRDLSELREIQRRGVSDDALGIWVRRLRPIDRMAVLRSGPAPKITSLEWYSPMQGVWMGRLPRVPSSAPASPLATP
ncbi:MAG TPA: hypothetical protein DHW34_05265 [Actinobacteria bacterium]|nr:hypothetical protein [Actinomycetota bacterium]